MQTESGWNNRNKMERKTEPRSPRSGESGVRSAESDGERGKMSAARKGQFKERPVVVQWDPERVMDPAAPPKEVMTRKTPEMRSIQIGERSGGTPSLPLPRSF